MSAVSLQSCCLLLLWITQLTKINSHPPNTRAIHSFHSPQETPLNPLPPPCISTRNMHFNHIASLESLRAVRPGT